MEDWEGLYKFLRLAILALALLGIAAYLFWPSRKERLEEPARRMLEGEDRRFPETHGRPRSEQEEER
jgi:cbb3-type cytochrome oxidase subunit 3